MSGLVAECCLVITLLIRSKSTNVNVILICRLVHAFTCAGMLPRQYMNFSLFVGMGVVLQKYISSGGG